MECSVMWCSGGCSWKCHKTLTFCSLLTRCTIPCACHAKRQLNLQKWSGPLTFLTCSLRNVLCSSLFYSSLFYSSLLSDHFHLCFSSVHTVRSLTSQLPSMIGMYKLESKPWVWKYDFWEIPTPIEGEGGGDKTNLANSSFFYLETLG